MIAEAAQQLFSLVQAIPALASSTGLAAGGKTPDPGGTKMPLPFAWIVADGAENTQDISRPLVPVNATTRIGYSVILYVPNIGQADLIANQFPLLEAIVQAVHGQVAPTGQRWFWKGYKLTVFNADRLCYRLAFLLDAAIS